MSKNIVVIESDLSLAQRLCAELEGKGFSATNTSDGKAAVDLVKREKPALVVLSVELSASQSGYAICSKLKKDESTKSIPVIITGRDAESFESHKRLLKARAEEYVLKPFEPSLLLEKVSKLIGMPKIQSSDLVLDDDALGTKGNSFIDEHSETRGGDPDLEMLDAAFESLSDQGSPPVFNASTNESFVTLPGDGLLEDSSAIDSDSLYELGEAGTEIDPLGPHGDKAEEDFVLDALEAIDGSRKNAAPPHFHPSPTRSPTPIPIASDDPELLSLREQVGTLGNKVRLLEDQLAEKTNELDAYLATSGGKDKEFFALREQSTKKDKEILRLKGEVNDKDHKIIDIEENQTRLEQTNMEITTELAKRDAQIKTFTQRQEAYVLERNKLDSSLNQSKDELRQLSARLATAQGELDQLQESNLELERNLDVSRTEISSIQKQLESCSAELEQTRVMADEAQDKIRVLEPEADRAIRLDEEVATMRSRIAELEQQVAKNEERVVKAYQRIRFDEKLRDKTKKALDVALQILEESDNSLENSIEETGT